MENKIEIKDKFYFENEFKKIDEKLLVIGSNKVMKELKNNNLKSIYLASNIPEDKEKELIYIADMNGIKVYKSELNSKYLGPLVKKNFNVLVIGVKKK